jgi:hypothetical protein
MIRRTVDTESTIWTELFRYLLSRVVEPWTTQVESKESRFAAQIAAQVHAQVIDASDPPSPSDLDYEVTSVKHPRS